MPTKTEDNPEVLLYTDGACSGNPGPGGWAFILEHKPTGKIMEESGGDPGTTNNRMEMLAVIEGLKRLKRPTRVHVITDSAYVKNGITEWIHGWKRNGWKRKVQNRFEPVKNEELWKEMDRLTHVHQVTFEQIRGHAGHPQNERCDELAVAAYQQYLKS